MRGVLSPRRAHGCFVLIGTLVTAIRTEGGMIRIVPPLNIFSTAPKESENLRSPSARTRTPRVFPPIPAPVLSRAEFCPFQAVPMFDSEASVATISTSGDTQR
jgi:hypothetical protein